MRKVLYYELRRVLCSWLFLAMFAVNGVYAWYVLVTDIIRGTTYTAPFSIWSYCAYTAKMMPAVVIAMLLLLSGYYGKKQKQAEVLISAAPVSAAQHLLVRSMVLCVCFMLLYAADAAMALFFYSRFFGYYQYLGFFLPALFILLPCFLAAAGAGHLLARLHQGLAFLLAGLLAAAWLSETGHVWELFGTGYFQAFPQTLAPGPDGEPGFFMQPEWLAARAAYALLGAVLLWLGIRNAVQGPERLP